MSRKVPRSGFTLVELLVVIAIIGVLIALLLPAVQAAREAARRSSCLNNLKQLGLSLHTYHDVNGHMPLASELATTAGARPPSWIVHVLPFMEQNNAYSQSIFDGNNWRGDGSIANQNAGIFDGLVLPVLNCPSSPMPTTRTDDHETQISCYAGVAGDYNEGISWWNGYHGMTDYNGVIIKTDHVNSSKLRMAMITDGTSNTLAIGEQSDWTHVRDTTTGEVELYDHRASNWKGGAWCGGGGEETKGECYVQCVSSTRVGINYVPSGKHSPHGVGMYWYGRPGNHTIFLSAHPTGCQFVLADGSVRFFSENMSFDTMTKLSNREDGFVINE